MKRLMMLTIVALIATSAFSQPAPTKFDSLAVNKLKRKTGTGYPDPFKAALDSLWKITSNRIKDGTLTIADFTTAIQLLLTDSLWNITTGRIKDGTLMWNDLSIALRRSVKDSLGGKYFDTYKLASGDIPKYNGSKWVMVPDTSGNGNGGTDTTVMNGDRIEDSLNVKARAMSQPWTFGHTYFNENPVLGTGASTVGLEFLVPGTETKVTIIPNELDADATIYFPNVAGPQTFALQAWVKALINGTAKRFMFSSGDTLAAGTMLQDGDNIVILQGQATNDGLIFVGGDDDTAHVYIMQNGKLGINDNQILVGTDTTSAGANLVTVTDLKPVRDSLLTLFVRGGVIATVVDSIDVSTDTTVFRRTLSGNSVIAFKNASAGLVKTIKLIVTNVDHSLSFRDTAIVWQGGNPPVLSQNAEDIFTFQFLASAHPHGSVEQGFRVPSVNEDSLGVPSIAIGVGITDRTVPIVITRPAGNQDSAEVRYSPYFISNTVDGGTSISTPHYTFSKPNGGFAYFNSGDTAIAIPLPGIDEGHTDEQVWPFPSKAIARQAGIRFWLESDTLHIRRGLGGNVDSVQWEAKFDSAATITRSSGSLAALEASKTFYAGGTIDSTTNIPTVSWSSNFNTAGFLAYTMRYKNTGSASVDSIIFEGSYTLNAIVNLRFKNVSYDSSTAIHVMGTISSGSSSTTFTFASSDSNVTALESWSTRSATTDVDRNMIRVQQTSATGGTVARGGTGSTQTFSLFFRKYTDGTTVKHVYPYMAAGTLATTSASFSAVPGERVSIYWSGLSTHAADSLGYVFPFWSLRGDTALNVRRKFGTGKIADYSFAVVTYNSVKVTSTSTPQSTWETSTSSGKFALGTSPTVTRTVGGLSPDTKYYFAARVFKGTEESPNSNVEYTTTTSAPSNSSSLTSIWAMSTWAIKLRKTDMSYPLKSGNRVFNNGQIYLRGGKNYKTRFLLVFENGGLTLVDSNSARIDTLFGPGGAKIFNSGTGYSDPFTLAGRNISSFLCAWDSVVERSPVYADGSKPGFPITRPVYPGENPVTDSYKYFYSGVRLYEGLIPFEADPGWFANGQGGTRFDVRPGENEVMWFDVYVPRDATTGTYSGPLKVYEGGRLVKTITVNLQVYGTVMPDTNALHVEAMANFVDMSPIEGLTPFNSGFWDYVKRAMFLLKHDRIDGQFSKYTAMNAAGNYVPSTGVGGVASARAIDVNLFKYFSSSAWGFGSANGYAGPGQYTPNWRFFYGFYDAGAGTVASNISRDSKNSVASINNTPNFNNSMRWPWSETQIRAMAKALAKATRDSGVVFMVQDIDEPGTNSPASSSYTPESYARTWEHRKWIKRAVGDTVETFSNNGAPEVIFRDNRDSLLSTTDLHIGIREFKDPTPSWYGQDHTWKSYIRSQYGAKYGLENSDRPAWGNWTIDSHPADIIQAGALAFKDTIDLIWLWDIASPSDWSQTGRDPFKIVTWGNNKRQLGWGRYILPGNDSRYGNDRNLSGPIPTARLKWFGDAVQFNLLLHVAREAGMDLTACLADLGIGGLNKIASQNAKVSWAETEDKYLIWTETILSTLDNP